MRKTYAESWFIYCQPNSKLMDCLSGPKAFAEGFDVVVLQSEVITKDYLLFEVINKEDYNKYQKYSLDYMTTLENSVKDLQDRLKSAADKIDNLEEQLRCSEQSEEKSHKDFRRAKMVTELLGEISYITDPETNEHTYLIRDSFVIDKDLYDRLAELYRIVGWEDLIIGQVFE